MKKYLILILIVVINVSSIYAQEYYNLYKDYLPQKHEKVISADMINLQIKSDGATSTELIYHRIRYINSLVNGIDNNPATNGYNQLRELTFRKFSQKNKLIENNLNDMKTKYVNQYFYQKGVDLLKKNLTEFKNTDAKYDVTPDYNNNLDCYMQYLYYVKDSTMRYDSTLNYRELLRKEKEKIALSIKNQYDNVSDYSVDENYKLIEKSLDNWELFIEYSNKLPSISEIIALYYSDKMAIKKENKFSVYAGFRYNLFQNTSTITLNDFPEIQKELLSNVSFDIAKIKDTWNLSLQTGYKFYVKDSKTIFSYLNTSLVFNYGKVSISDSSYSNSNSYDYFSEYNSENDFTLCSYVITQNDFSVNNKLGLLLKVTTPLIYFSDNLFLEVGAIGGVEKISMSYGFTFNLTIRKVNSSGVTFPAKIKGQKIKKTEDYYLYYASPVLALNYILAKNVNTELFMYMNAIGVNFGVTF